MYLYFLEEKRVKYWLVEGRDWIENVAHERYVYQIINLGATSTLNL